MIILNQCSLGIPNLTMPSIYHTPNPVSLFGSF